MKNTDIRAGVSFTCARPPFAAVVVLVVFLALAVPHRSSAEDRVDVKYMYYQEDNDRIQVLSPTVLFESDLSPTLTIKIQGVYDSISGASPTGAPPLDQPSSSATPSPAATQPYSVYVNEAQDNEDSGAAHDGDDDEDDEREGDRERGRGRSRMRAAGLTASPLSRLGYHAKAGATPTPAPAPAPLPAPVSSGNTSSSSSAKPASTSTPAPAPAPKVSGAVPVADASDNRTAFNIDLDKKIDNHTVGGQVSYSTESDYESLGVAIRDAIDFNKKNTTLTLGTAYTHDNVDAYVRGTTEDKDTIDAMVGLTQVLSPTTLFTVNLTLGQATGYLDDQYKIVQLNGVLIPEKRPDSKDKTILFLSLNQFFKAVDGSAELSYRYYDDSFGIVGNTYELAWYQKLGRQIVVRPMVRYYQQTAADFYGVSFTGSPQYYSADYRLSELDAIGYGLKFIWTPMPSFSLDAGVERYEMEGKDGVTHQDAYPSASIVTVGARVWF